ncbi:MAG: hypothetical protein K8S20_15835 [Chloroflexi bacterium]|nr:hypothetical protein [Chloroflexota bacterium]
MQHKNTALSFLVIGLAIVITAGFYLMTATPASAQCGSQASSCKNCHETQAEMPVNADGTSWHQSHAFGDFCYICHAGNNQATDKAVAHQGMVSPLADIKASCQQCHVTDLDARAQVYATTLGVTLGPGSAAPVSGGDVEATPVAAAPASNTALVQSCNEIMVDDPNVVNYAQNYNEIVLGKKPINWGNSILLAMIALMIVGGGGFVITREKLVNISFGDTRKAEGEYPADVVEMLPRIAELKSQSRKSLKNVLDNPGKADKVLDLIDAVVSDKKDKE